MFQLLKNIKWFEWMFIGIVIAGGLGLRFFYIAYTEQLKENGGLIADNSQLQQTIEVKDKSHAITDNVVTEYHATKDDELREMEQSRTGVIDEYINLSGQDKVSKETAEPRPLEKTRDIPTWEPKTTIVESPAVVTDHRALRTLASRMQQHYCRAKRLDETCSPR